MEPIKPESFRKLFRFLKEREKIVSEIEQLDTVLQQDFTILVFTDNGFFLSDAYTQTIRDFYRQNRQLPYKVQAFRFVPVKEVK